MAMHVIKGRIGIVYASYINNVYVTFNPLNNIAKQSSSGLGPVWLFEYLAKFRELKVFFFTSLFAMSSPHTPCSDKCYDLRVAGSFKIGRSPLCNIILKNGHVSKIHCSLNIPKKDDHSSR